VEVQLPTPSYSQEILELAKHGARQRYQQLHAELASLVRMFPDLKDAAQKTAARKMTRSAASSRRRKTTWTTAQRKAVSVRMKKYWAARRKAKQ
jgi:hypothetical protein